MKIYNVTVTTLDYEGRVEAHNVNRGYYLNKAKAETKAEELKKNWFRYTNVEVKEIEVEE